MDQGGRGRARVEKSLLGSCYKATWAHPRTTDGRIGPSRVAPTPQGNLTTNQSETSLVSDAPWTKEADEGLKSSGLRAIRATKRGGHTHARRAELQVPASPNFRPFGPLTRFLDQKSKKKKPNGVHFAQTMRTFLAKNMHKTSAVKYVTDHTKIRVFWSVFDPQKNTA